MRALRRRAFTLVVPLVLSLVLGVPVAFATFTTGTFKTIGGGFLGGTVPNATTFTSPVTINAGPTALTLTAGSIIAAIDTSYIAANANQIGAFGALSFTTPDTFALRTGTLSNSFHIMEQADVTFDFQNCSAGTSAATDPTFCIHSHNQNTAQWIDLKHDGTNGVIDVGTGEVTFVDVVRFPDGSAGTPSIRFNTAGANSGFFGRTANAFDLSVNSVAQMDFQANSLGLKSTLVFGWSGGDPSGTAKDVGFDRLAAGVIGLNNGTAATAGGWLQQKSGELALNADYTNATTTFSNTALSATVISGRTYSFTLDAAVTDSTAADGLKIDFNGGSAAATNFRVGCYLQSDTGTTVAWTAAVATALATTLNVGAMATANQHTLRCVGTFVPSGAGTFIVRAAQNAHSTGTLTIHRGGALNIRDANPL